MCCVCFHHWWKLTYAGPATLEPLATPTKKRYSDALLNIITMSNASKKRKLGMMKAGSTLEPEAKKLKQKTQLRKHSIQHAAGWVPANCSCAHSVNEASEDHKAPTPDQSSSDTSSEDTDSEGPGRAAHSAPKGAPGSTFRFLLANFIRDRLVTAAKSRSDAFENQDVGRSHPGG
ncbi:MAG: hypothetical protein Q9174_002488 [Haloplaca sp. 1 TL-2023]